ncbi:MAG: aminomethyl-transferring glycine dehydrogenase subunit GcvPA [Clostridia bacterium]|nr:aminomethyl-transferring glycine dehydrogenase subunit GcvPA [Clostridia bacterium]
MGSYVPSTREERREMLRAIGLEDYRDLYKDVPQEMYLDRPLNLPEGMSELEVSRAMKEMAGKNRVFSTVLRGAGAYDHYIPSVVKYIPAKEEFLTAYTPYQAEMSQGVLQSIFEYQTMICALTGMDVSNASVYDGATAAAEAAAMCRDRKRRVTLISAAAHPDTINTVRTYCYGTNDELRIVPAKDGRTDMDALKEMLTEEVSSFYVQQPNFYGQFEEAEAMAELVHQAGAMYIMGCNPIALAIIKTPAECGADIAVGEGQPLGMPLSFGGPYLGYMATTTKHMRKLPGRIVGETVDAKGDRAFVLSLQAREQHIRREKASSNICSNQALCALTAGVYMASMGPEGMAEAARQSMAKAHYLANGLCAIPGVSLKYTGEYFHEFVTVMPKADEVLSALADADILGGLPVDGGILWCATEKVSKAVMDKAIAIVKEVLS